MQLMSEQSIKVSETSLDIKDALDTKNVSLRIEAAHAGVMNGNFLFYLPAALKKGATSLNKFYKPLQKKHYSKTLGYIYNSEYVETNTKSNYYENIVNSKNSKDLIKNVKAYMNTTEYENNRTGFGVLVAKAKLHDTSKIESLKANDTGTVSVAGDAGVAYCSICSGFVAECGHKLGQRYPGKGLCFGVVADDFEVDHISFETIPANWETNSLIIADSQLLGNIELIEEGQLMKLSLDQLKEKLGNIESVLAELNLSVYIEQYLKDVQDTKKSGFLLAAEQSLPFSTPLTIYVTKLLLDQLEDSGDKTILEKVFGTSYTDIFEGKTEEEISELLTAKQQDVTVVDQGVEPIVEPIVEPQPDNGESKTLAVTDANALALAIADSLAVSLENSFGSFFEKMKDVFSKEQENKANKLLEDRLEALKADLVNSDTATNLVTNELKQSLINQILLLKNVEFDSEYCEKLKSRSVQELKMTLEDHIQLTTNKVTTTTVVEPVVEPTVIENPLVVKDSQNAPTPVVTAAAIENMDEPVVDPVLEITDADIEIEKIVNNISEKLTKSEYTTLYKKTVFEQGSKVAKKLHSALKAQNKI